jgi:hypothetical protein
MTMRSPCEIAAEPAPVLTPVTRRTVLCALVGACGAVLVPRTAAGADAPVSLAAPERLAQLHVAATGELLALSATGRLWQFDGRTWQQRGEGLDPRAPLASGHGRIAGRAAAGGLWVLEAGRATQVPAPRLMPDAGLHVLPLGVIAVAEGAGGRAYAVRLEPASADAWRETARSTEPVLPDARPQQVDLDGPLSAAGDGHILVLGGPDGERYRHAVLGDSIEATRVLYLERHSLAPLRTLALPAPHVLEDIAPRPIEWAGATGLLTVRSGPQGAQLAVVAADRAQRDALALAALGEPLGTPNRWMAATTDGRRLLAVHTPHIGGALHEYVREANALRGRRIADAYSSHALGSRELDLAAWAGGALVLPGQDRRTLHALAGESWSQRSVYALRQPVVATRAWRSGGRPGAAALLADGSVVWVAAAP